MPEKLTSAGKRAYRLYNKKGATDLDKIQAQALIYGVKPEDLDVYGRFVSAEIIFWKRLSDRYAYAQAIEIFQKILLDKQLPKPLLVGACFFLGRMYELGLGTEHNAQAAYEHYRLANRLNPEACAKDVDRLQKLLNGERKNTASRTPDRFSYRDDDAPLDESEYEEYLQEWAEEMESCQRSLADNGFFYADDPDEKDVDEDELYNVTPTVETE